MLIWEEMCRNVHSSFIHVSPKLEAVEMSTHNRMGKNKLWCVHALENRTGGTEGWRLPADSRLGSGCLVVAGPPQILCWFSSMWPQVIDHLCPWRLEYKVCGKEGKTYDQHSEPMALLRLCLCTVEGSREGVRPSGASGNLGARRKSLSSLLPLFLPASLLPPSHPLLLLPSILALSSFLLFLPWKEPMQRVDILGRRLGRSRGHHEVEISQKTSRTWLQVFLAAHSQVIQGGGSVAACPGAQEDDKALWRDDEFE